MYAEWPIPVRHISFIMVITWYGQACFKLQSGELVGVIDPYSRDIGLTPPRFRSDFLLITHDHMDHNNAESIPQENLITVAGPGEYDVRGVYIRGIQTYHDAKEGKERGLNTIYVIEMEGIKICHMGDFGEPQIREETLEAIGDVDILMIPVGGTYTIDAEEASHVISQIDPRIVIPMHYKIPGLKVGLEPIDKFLKEMGIKSKDAEDKLTLKKKDLPNEGLNIVVLKTP